MYSCIIGDEIHTVSADRCCYPTETNTRECKEMLQGYMTGQLSSALGQYQVVALRREFKSFTDVIDKSMIKFKENVETKLRHNKSMLNTVLNTVWRKIIQWLFDLFYFPDTSISRAVYTRWGKMRCQANAEIVFSGYDLKIKKNIRNNSS